MIFLIIQTLHDGKKITIKDIAKKADVSVTTVSFVMRNEMEGGTARYRVGKETTEKILRIADELNYKPSNAAQSLRSGRTYTIGVVVSDISNNFFSDIARKIEDTAYGLDYSVIFGSTDENPDKFERIVDVFMGRGIDGLILVPCENCLPTIKKVIEANIPLMLLDRTIREYEVDSITLNNHRAAAMAVEHLVKSGRKRIEMISYAMNVSNIKEREAGYRAAMTEHGLADNIKIHTVRFKDIPVQMEKIVRDLSKRRVDALFFATNTLTIEGIKKLSGRDRNFEKISVVGFDESEAFDLAQPFIPHVKQPVGLFGTESVKILLDSITNRKQQVVSIKLNPELVTGRNW
ncbi:MAG: LacI family transcriptional regulator [Rikenellaceae bacterium]|nr:LacI family transcriptional regulator [Rikenellaceae bacterium]